MQAEPGDMRPPRIDCETAQLLRSFLSPLIDRAASWAELRTALEARGYRLAFRGGRMILTDADTGNAICTGRSLGTPLRDLAARIGRPSLRLDPGGMSAHLSL